jgi:hypothetical protein
MKACKFKYSFVKEKMTRYEAYESTIHFGWISVDKYPFIKHIFHPQQFLLCLQATHI